MRRSFRRSHRSSSRRRKLAWARGFVADSGLGNVPAGTIVPASFWYKVPAGVLNTGVQPDGAIEPEDWTLVRTRISVQVEATPHGTDSSGLIVGAGLLVWEANTDNIPVVGSYPVPVENGDADWLWHWVACSGQGNSPIAPQIADTLGAPDSVIQSKAMRKLSSRQGLLFVVEVSASLMATGQSAQFDGYTFYGRSLFKLP